MSNLFKPLEEGYQLDVNMALSNAWSRYKKNFFTYFLVGGLFFSINLLVGSIPYLSFLGNFTSVILFSGFYIYSKNKDNGVAENADFFSGYKYLGALTLYQLVLMILIVPLLAISMSSIIPIEGFLDLLIGKIDVVTITEQLNSEAESVGTNIILGLFLVIGLAIYLSISFVFATPLIVLGKLNFWTAMELSRKTVGKQFFVFLFFWMAFLIFFGFAAILTYGVAYFLINPLMYLIIYEMYKQVFEPIP